MEKNNNTVEISQEAYEILEKEALRRGLSISELLKELATKK